MTGPVGAAGGPAAADWAGIGPALERDGYAVLPGLLAPAECRRLAALYDEDAPFRSRVVMQRHGFGRGEYRYFAYPLPAPVQALRSAAYPALAAIANDWHARLGRPERLPARLEEFLEICRRAGQGQPTPLLLRYGPGDYNCLHQDVYGPLVCPLQMTVLLAEPGRDFAGGEFVLVEQRPRAQSRAEIVPLGRGDAVVFPVRDRPVAGTRGTTRVHMRHGVSRVRAGHRHSLGIIFHDAA